MVVAIGRAPLVRALVAMAREIGFDTAVVERDAASLDDLADPDAEVHHQLDLDKLGVGRSSFVVVATMGRYDEDALEAALATDAAYVGLVASRRRGEAVMSSLRAAGIPEDRLARVSCPAGLDLGAVAHEEIAVAILAEMVQERAIGLSRRAPGEDLEEAMDPVCGMAVLIDSATDTVDHDGVMYSFCSSGCRRRFEADPSAFV
jgi:xanthine dehydrogenase accessory factor